MSVPERNDLAIGDVNWVSHEVLALVEDVVSYLEEYLSSTHSDQDGSRARPVFNSCIPLLEQASLTLEFVNAIAGSQFCNDAKITIEQYVDSPDKEIDSNAILFIFEKLKEFPSYLERIVKNKSDIPEAFAKIAPTAEKLSSQEIAAEWYPQFADVIDAYLTAQTIEISAEMTFDWVLKENKQMVMGAIVETMKTEETALSPEIAPVFLRLAKTAPSAQGKLYWTLASLVARQIFNIKMNVSQTLKRQIAAMGKHYDLSLKQDAKDIASEFNYLPAYDSLVQLVRIFPLLDHTIGDFITTYEQATASQRQEKSSQSQRYFESNYDHDRLQSLSAVLTSLLDPARSEDSHKINLAQAHAECTHAYFYSLQSFCPFLIDALVINQSLQTELPSPNFTVDLQNILSLVNQVIEHHADSEEPEIADSIGLHEGAKAQVVEVIEAIKLAWLADRSHTDGNNQEWYGQLLDLLRQLVSLSWSDHEAIIELKSLYQELFEFFSIAYKDLTWNNEINDAFGEMISGVEIVVHQEHYDTSKLKSIHAYVQEALSHFKKNAYEQQGEQRISSSASPQEDESELQIVQRSGLLVIEDKFNQQSYEKLAVRGAAEYDELTNQFLEEATESIPALNQLLQSIASSEQDPQALTEGYDLLQRLANGATLVSCDLFAETARILSYLIKLHKEFSMPVDQATSTLMKDASLFIPQLVNQIAGNSRAIPDLFPFLVSCQHHIAQLIERSNVDDGLVVQQGETKQYADSSEHPDTLSQPSESPQLQETIDDILSDTLAGSHSTPELIDALIDITGTVEQGETFRSTPKLLELLHRVYELLFKSEESTSNISLNFQHVINYAQARLEDQEPWNKRAIIMLTILTRSIFGFRGNVEDPLAEENQPIEKPDYSYDAHDEEESEEMPAPPKASIALSPDDPVSISAATNEISEEVMSIYLEESQELLANLFSLVSRVAKTGAQEKDLEEFRRIIHTVKGSANMVGLTDLGNLFHLLEDIALLLVENPKKAYEIITQDMFEVVNWVSVNDLQIIKGARNDEVTYYTNQITGVLKRLQGESTNPPNPETPSSAPATASGDRAEAGVNISSGANTATVERSDKVSNTQLMDTRTVDSSNPQAQLINADTTTSQSSEAEEERILLSLESMRDLIESSSEIKVYSDSSENMINRNIVDIREIKEKVSQLGIDASDLVTVADTNIKSSYDNQVATEEAAKDMSSTTDFDPLEFDEYNEVQQLSRVVSEQVSDLKELLNAFSERHNQLSESLQREKRVVSRVYKGLMGFYLSEAGRFVANLSYLATITAREVNKKIKFVSSGDDLLVDRQVLKKITIAGEHIVRNAIIHGIEDEATRVQLNKPEAGTISVSFSRDGPYVKIVFEDDGYGIDYVKLRAKLEQLGILKNKEEKDADLIKYIFKQDVSTSSKADKHSGRGVGMNIVRDVVHGLSGLLEVKNRPKKGCVFLIRIPYSLNLTQIIALKTGSIQFGVLYSLVKTNISLENKYISELYSRTGKYRDQNTEYLIIPLANLVQQTPVLSRSSIGELILFENVEGANIALWVDSSERSGELAIKSLGRQVATLGLFVGGTYLESGTFLFILNLTALYNSYLDRLAEQGNDANTPVIFSETTKLLKNSVLEGEMKNEILIVDDSITIRKYLTLVLERENFSVVSAGDGADGLKVLTDRLHDQVPLPDMIITDIEMPVMDGLDFVQEVRDNQQLSSIPVAIITSRVAAKHRTEAERLGVKAFFGKPFLDSELIEKVREIIAALPESNKTQ